MQIILGQTNELERASLKLWTCGGINKRFMYVYINETLKSMLMKLKHNRNIFLLRLAAFTETQL